MNFKKRKLTFLIQAPLPSDDFFDYNWYRNFPLWYFQENGRNFDLVPDSIRIETTFVLVNVSPSNMGDRWSRILITMKLKTPYSLDHQKQFCLGLVGELQTAGHLSSELSPIYATCYTGTYPSVMYLADIDATPLDITIIYGAGEFNHSPSLFKKIMTTFFGVNTAQVACARGPGGSFYTAAWLHPDQARAAFATYPYGQLFYAATGEQISFENLEILCQRIGGYHPQVVIMTRGELLRCIQFPVLRKNIWEEDGL